MVVVASADGNENGVGANDFLDKSTMCPVFQKPIRASPCIVVRLLRKRKSSSI